MSVVSPLKAERLWLERIEVILAQSYKDDKPDDYRVGLKVNVKKRKDALAFRVRLSIELTPESGCHCRYERIAIATLGQFHLPDDTPEETLRQLVPFNCVAILHGFSRGIVAQLTGLNDGGALLLPAINYIDALRIKKAKPRSSAKAQMLDAPKA
ncbi:MAG: protein-export chaperone SecB [Armatimonadota bacterium]|nr:protein-export chaperone SecB [Armatimonadota bacterium]